MEVGFMLLTVTGITALIYTIAGLVLNDIRGININKAYSQHPHARRWRKRPTIRVADATNIPVVRQSGYRKVGVFSEETTKGDLWLQLPHHITLAKGSLNQAIRQFASTSSLATITILPQLRSPQTIRQLFYNHRIILTAPFATARSGFTLKHNDSLFPILYSSRSIAVRKNSLFRGFSILLRSAVFACFVYSLYLSMFLMQPELLLLFLAGFFSWAIWSIGRYPHISFAQKIGYTALLPASLSYFIFRLCTSPLRFQ